MIIGSGFRGASRIGSPRSMRGFRIHGFGAMMSFGEDTPTSGWSDTTLGPSYNPDQLGTPRTSGVDYGTLATGIGTGVGSLLTGIGNLVGKVTGNPSTNQYGGPYAQQPQSGISPALIGAGILGLGVLLVVMKK